MTRRVPDTPRLTPSGPPPVLPTPPAARPLMTWPPAPPPRRRVRWMLIGILAIVVFALVIALVAVSGTGYVYKSFAATMGPAPLPASSTPVEKRLTQLRGEQKKLQTTLARKIPNGTYIVIDQTHNRVYLKKGQDVVLEAVCSAGSGLVLRESATGGRKWVFDTPRGAFKVLERRENPVWKKPDWAFVEEGKPIPRNDSDRFEYGMLGEYALYFGNGYMLHGTLYERLLGRSVTHGCIRLGRDDLRVVWRDTAIGTRIFIY